MRPVRAELFHADRRIEIWTDGRRNMTEPIVTVSNLANMLNIVAFKC